MTRFVKRTAERNPAPSVIEGRTEAMLREETRRPDGGYFPPVASGGYSIVGPTGAVFHYNLSPWES
jgi:hypothetical protein